MSLVICWCLYWGFFFWRCDTQHNDTQHNNTQHNNILKIILCIKTHSIKQSIDMLSGGFADCHLYWVSHKSPLCWVSLCWVSLCWVSWRCFSIVQMPIWGNIFCLKKPHNNGSFIRTKEHQQKGKPQYSLPH
jgi:hypothetical protein